MADSTIAELPDAGSVNGTDLVPIFRDGQTYSATVSAVQVANTTPTYVTMGSEASLPNERVLTAGTGITIVDNGAGSTAVVQIGTNPVIPGSARVKIPAGTTAERSGGTFGDFRANSETLGLEFFDGASWVALASGTVYVSSVGLSLPAEFTVSGSPITTSGTLGATWASTSQNYVFAGPTSGAGTPGFRALVAGDIPSLPYLGSTLTSANFFVGNGSNVATAVSVSGDASLANTGALTVGSIGGKAVSLGGAFTVSGAFATTLTVTAGTNVTLPTSGTLLADNGSGASLTGITAAQVGAVSTTLTSANIIVGNGSNVATAVAVTGDVTISNAGVTAIGLNKVTTGMLAQATGSTILGNSSTSTADVAALTDAQVATVLARYLELAPRWYS